MGGAVMIKRLLMGSLILLWASVVSAATTCPIHNDEPTLTAALAQPVPTVNVIPDAWADVGDRLISAQGHLSRADGTMRHTHLEIPEAVLYCEINGPLTFPFRIVLFQTDGYFDAPAMIGEDLVRVVWDATGTSTPPDMHGDPNLGALKTWTGHMTIDPTHPINWRPQFNAPPHGWYNEAIHFFTRYTDRMSEETKLMFGMYSMIDPTQPEVTEADPVFFPAVYPQKALRVDNSPIGFPLSDGSQTETFWGGHTVIFEHVQLPTFGTLVAPYSPATPPTAFIYAGHEISAIFESVNATTDFRVGQDLHHGIPGTFLAQNNQLNICCGEPLPITFDPAQLGTGLVKTTLNWNFSGGPSAPNFPTFRMVSALLTFGVQSGVAPPQPPPTTTCYIGTVKGTSTDGGVTILPVGAIVWASVPCQ